MGPLQDDTIGGFNKFIEEQKLVPGKATVTLTTFSSDVTTVHDFVDISNVEPLTRSTYSPGGSTALWDALATTIDTVGKTLATMPEAVRPSKVLVLVITDGQENTSRRYKASDVRHMVQRQEKEYAWTFTYLGSDIDTFADAGTIGVASANVAVWHANAVGAASAYTGLTRGVASYRTSETKTNGDIELMGAIKSAISEGETGGGK
jgi:hypothetical protein